MNKDSNYIIHTNPHCFISTKYISPDSELLHIQGGTILKIGKYSLHIKMVKKKTFLKIAILTLFVFVPILALFTACGGNAPKYL